MVSLNSVSHLKFILTFSLLLLFSYNAYAAFERGDNLKPVWVCIIGQTKCCVNGTRSCCPDNGTIYDTTSCSCTEGTKQYKPKGSCGTSIQTCCSDGTWSGWDSSCPVSKTCSSSTKPSTRTTCNGGYKYRTVTCNTSTGEWQTGAWGDCDCSDPAYEEVTLRGGGTCCQRKDGTGLRCATDQEIIGNRWESWGRDQTYFCYNMGGPNGTILGCSNVVAGAECSPQGSRCCRNFEIFYCR